MSEHNHEWIPPRDDGSILGFTPQDTVRPDTSVEPEVTEEPSILVKQFASVATGIIMFSLLGLTIILVVGIAIRMIRWVGGI